MGVTSIKMFVVLFYITCLAFPAPSLASGPADDTIKLVTIFFRHGDRSPTDSYPKDPYINFEWFGGLGALSQKGALQLYNLGENLRERYYMLLPENGLYTKEEIFVLSSYAERCIMSAQSLLAGFMPPPDEVNVLPIKWQPIAVNVLPRNDDILVAQKKACKLYDEYLKNLYINPPDDVKEMNENNKELYRYLTKYTGKNISTILDVEFLFNTLEIEQNAGLHLPDWTDSVFPENMLPITERSYTLFTETDMMKKVKSGPFLAELVNNMISKSLGKLTPNRKIFLYSGHDVTLVNIMNSLKILNQTAQRPEYGSAIVFELHNTTVVNDDWEIKIFYYRNSDDNSPKQINIINCDTPCSLRQFHQSTSNLILENYDEFCKNEPNDSNWC